MTTLYIIGNGFDLWHGLPTKWQHFYAYAKDVIEELEAYYVSEDQPWHDFENFLGNYDWQSFYDEYDHTDVMSESFRPSEAYGLTDELTQESEDLVESIEAQFRDWVDAINVSVASQKMVFDSSSRFLTFNYTETLQTVYGIPSTNVLHIHGKASADEKLIFGHGESREEEPELDEEGNSNRTIFTDAEGAAKYPFYAFQKPVQELIEKNCGYFQSLSSVTKIVVIGHSLNDIDLPYFQEVAKNTPGCSWVVYYHGESESEYHRSQLGRCGVAAHRIEPRAYR